MEINCGGGGGGEDISPGSKNSGGGSCGSDGEMKTATLLKKGPWTAAEDAILKEYVEKYGEGNWNAVQRNSGLARCGKSCRLRWANHLRPNLKKGAFSPDEERLILELHAKLGNKWARMASQLPGRTDNEIKNYWNTRVKRRLRQGLPLYPQELQGRASPYYHHQSNITQTQNLLPTSPSSNSPMLSPHQSISPHSNSSPLSLLDANSRTSGAHFFTPLTPPPLSLPSNRFKRYRNLNIEFSLNPISSTSLPSSPLGQYMPSPLGQSMLNQLPHMPSYSLGSPHFDQNSPSQLYQTQYKSDDGLVPSTGGFTFSVKPELPSSQLFQTAMQCDTDSDNDVKRGMNVAAQHGSGLLDDLLRESQTISGGGESKRRGSSLGSEQEKGFFDGFLSHWDDSGSIPSSSGMKTREDPAENINFMHEDLSSILNIMPQTMKVPLWFGNTEEISNGQSSGGVDNLGIDMQQLTSSLPISSSNWDNMPGIC